MERNEERKLIADLAGHLERGGTALADAVRHQPASDYVDTDRLEAERRLLFREYPLMLEPSQALAEPGDFTSRDVSGIPVLAVRGRDGQVRCFLNVCRHRGNRLCTEASGNRRRLKCQYHAWTYDLEGNGLTFIDPEGFDGLELSDFGLIEFPSEERHGFVWFIPSPEAKIDVASHLGEQLDRELAAYGIGSQHVFKDSTEATPFNWKLGVDTFMEVFHLAYLHKHTVGPFFIGNTAHFEDRGLHHRLTGVRKTFPEILSRPEEEQDVYPHTSIVHFIFPNTFITWQMDHIEIWNFFPDAASNAASVTRSLLVVDPEPTTDKVTQYWQKNWDVLLDAIWNEDFVAMEAIQANLESGVLPELVFGRNEIALQRFHEKIDSELQLRDLHSPTATYTMPDAAQPSPAARR